MPYLTQKELEELPDNAIVWGLATFSENVIRLKKKHIYEMIGFKPTNKYFLIKEAAEEQLRYDQVLKKLGAQNNTADNKVSWHNAPQILASEPKCTYIVESEPE